MLNATDIIKILIKEKYNNIKNFYMDNNYENIYDLIPHSSRYNILKYTLKLVSIPFTLIIETTKFFTFGTISFKYLNVGDIFLNKMNQNISKKILLGLPEENNKDQTIPEIVDEVLKIYRKQHELISQPEPSFLQKCTNKANEYIPGFSKIINFWNNGGIKYADEIHKQKQIVNIIYKKIISEAYNAGKKGEKLEISDVKKLFPQVDFEEKIKLNIEEVVVKNNTIDYEQPIIEQTAEKIIAADPIACDQQPIEQNTHKCTEQLTNYDNALLGNDHSEIICC